MKTTAIDVHRAGRVRAIGDSEGRPAPRGVDLERQRAATRPARAVDPVPVWLSALVAARCQVNRNGEYHAVLWICASGRAQYTNAGVDAELVQPLGVHLQGGQTLAVCWQPGKTDYTLEVYRQDEMCA